MWLLIDDVRDLNCEMIARTPEAAKHALTCDSWECVCFDHNLGCDEFGYDIMKWMLEQSIFPPRIQLVTSNPVGRENMKMLLSSHGYVTKDGVNFNL